MIHQIFAITSKEFKVLINDRRAFSNLFLIPIAFILVMTVALQGVFDSGSSNNPVDLLIVNRDQGEIASRVVTNLSHAAGLTLIETNDGKPLTQSAAEDLITGGTYSIALVFPEDFSDRILAAAIDSSADKAQVSFIADPAVGQQLIAPIQGLVEGYIERQALQAQEPIRLDRGFKTMVSAAPAGQADFIRTLGARFTEEMNSSSVNTENNPGFDIQVALPTKYQATRNPTSAEQNVPGYTIYGVFLIITTISTGLFREKNEGTLRRLQATPISRAAILIGKLLPYYLINLIQIVLMLAVGMAVFHIGLGNHPWVLVPLSLATAAAATGLGLFVTGLGKTQEQVSSLSLVLSIVLSVLGGLMVPLYVMPDFLQKFSMIIPHAWALNGFLDVMVRGQGIGAEIPVIAGLLGFAMIFWVMGIWRFRLD
jgi:ABC-2 type transport system permease protein